MVSCLRKLFFFLPLLVPFELVPHPRLSHFFLLPPCSLSANIITRGRRSLGYGFVEFATEAEAEKAVAAMNKKEISGRPINVEVARPRDDTKEEVREKRAPKPRQPRAPKAEGAAPAEGASPAAERPRRGRRAPATEGAAATSPAATEGAARGGRRAPAAGAVAGAAAARRPAAPRRPAEVRPTSETTLFVANVPFSTDDEQLRSFFAEHKPKSAHVVRMRNGRSRGYGFVEFEDAAGQNAGLAVNGKEVPLPNGTNLKLSVKVAMTPPVITPAEEDASAPVEVAAN